MLSMLVGYGWSFSSVSWPIGVQLVILVYFRFSVVLFGDYYFSQFVRYTNSVVPRI